MKSIKNITPMIYEKTKDGEALYDVYSRLIKERIIYIAEEIDSDVATTVSATLLFLDYQSKDKPIQLYLNSPGGSVSDGLFTIYDTMNYVESPVHTCCIGTAYSAASFLLAAGEPGYRKAFPNAEIMMHQVSSGVCGNSDKMERYTKRVVLLNQKLEKYLAKHTGQKLSVIQEKLSYDSYFNAEEALDFGIIDGIVGQDVKKKNKNITKKKV